MWLSFFYVFTHLPKAYFGYQLSNLARPRNQRVFDLRQVLRFSRGGRWLGVGMPAFLVDWRVHYFEKNLGKPCFAKHLITNSSNKQ